MNRSWWLAAGFLWVAAAQSSWAGVPDWAKPYMQSPLPPQEGHIAKADHWILLLHEVEVRSLPKGGLGAIVHEVYALHGTPQAPLAVEMSFDPELSTASLPEIWVPGRMGYKSLNVEKHGVESPDISEDVLTSGRLRFVSADNIEEGKRVVVSYSIEQKESAGQDLVFQVIQRAPCQLFRVLKSAGEEGDVDVALVDPSLPGEKVVHSGTIEIANIPSVFRTRWGKEPWLPAPWQELPYVVVSRKEAQPRTWSWLASHEAARMEAVLSKDEPSVLAQKAKELLVRANSEDEKVACLASFVQALPFRPIGWGEGAYLPSLPSETLRTMTADCKSKVLLLMAMLRLVGVRSVPILCRSESGYLDAIPCPFLALFNHVVLAIDLPARTNDPAALAHGPGTGWLVFDPTDPWLALGEAPSTLEGSPALWIAKDEGGLITLRMKTAAGKNPHVGLHVKGADLSAAPFEFLLDGASLVGRVLGHPPSVFATTEALNRRCDEYFGSAVPGLTISGASVIPADHRQGRPATLLINGTLASPFRAAGGGLYGFPLPLVLIGRALAMPREFGAMPDVQKDEEKIAESRWTGSSRYQGTPISVAVEIQLDLNPPIHVEGFPALKASADASWLKCRSGLEGSMWRIALELPRGCFDATSRQQRLRDMNLLAAFFRSSVLLSDQTKP